MTATDELRRMLDERGAKYRDYFNANKTWWGGRENVGWYAEDRPSASGLYVMIEAVLTPEQAIAATLGDIDATPTRQGDAGTCRADETDTIKCWVKGKDEPSVEHAELIHVMECSVCGGTYEHVNGGYEFCPRCGAKVVVE